MQTDTRFDTQDCSCVACGRRGVEYFCELPGRFDRTGTLGASESVHYVQCPGCRTIQQYPLPTEEQLSNSVIAEYTQTEDRVEFERVVSDNAELQHRAIASTLTKYGISANVLEVGTGVGNLCAILIENGITAVGIDITPELVLAAQKRGLPVERQNLKTLPLEMKRSAIVMSHVFEHLSEPEEILRHVRDRLEPQGLFLSAQPTAAMTSLVSRALRANRVRTVSPFGIAYLSLNRWHFVLYSIEGMRTLAERMGFELLEVVPMPSVRSSGLLGVVRYCYSRFNSLGERIMPRKWPFHVAHLFVLRRVG